METIYNETSTLLYTNYLIIIDGFLGRVELDNIAIERKEIYNSKVIGMTLKDNFLLVLKIRDERKRNTYFIE